MTTAQTSSTNEPDHQLALYGTAVYEVERDFSGIISEFRLNRANSFAPEAIGRAQTELYGIGLEQLFPAGDVPFLKQQFAVVIDFHRTVRFSLALPQPDETSAGTCWDVVVSPHEAGLQVTYQSTLTDDLILNRVTCGVLVGTAIRGAEGRIEDIRINLVNKPAADRLGMAVADMVGKRHLDVYPGLVKSGLFAMYTRTIETGEALSQELYYAYDGLNMWVSIETQPYGDGLVITWLDITDRKLAEIMQQQQADLLQTVTQNSTSMIDMMEAVRDDRGEIVDFVYRMVNPKALELMGLPAERVLGHRLLTLFPGVQEAGVFDRLKAVTETGISQEHEIHYTAESYNAWVNSKYTKYRDGVVTISYDLTLTQLAELHKKQQAELYKTVFNTALTAISLLEAVRDEQHQIVDFRFELLNKEAISMAGQPEADLIGQSLTTRFPGTITSGLLAHYVEVATTQQARQFEIDYTYDGFDLWTLLAVSPYKNGVVVSSLNITKQKLAEHKAQLQADLLKSIQNTTQMGIAAYKPVRDKDGTVVDFAPIFRNSAARRLAGLSTDIAQEATLVELAIAHYSADTTPDELTRYVTGFRQSDLFQRFVRVAETRQSDHIEQELFNKKTKLWVDLTIQPWREGILINSLDTSQLRQTEREKIRQADLLKTIVDNTQTGIVLYEIITDEATNVPVDFRIVMANPVNEKAAGRSVSAMLGRTVREEYAHLLETIWWERIMHCARTGETQQFLFNYADEGISGWFDVSFVHYDQYVLFTFLDISELKNNELARLQQSNLLQQVVNNTQAGVALAQPVRNKFNKIIDFRYLVTNKFQARVTGKSIEEMNGAVIGDLFPGWQSTDTFRHFVDTIESGESRQSTYPYAGYGIQGWFDNSYNCIDDCLLYTYTDVTSLKEAELALQRKNDLLMGVVDNGKAGITLFDPILDEHQQVADFRYVFTNSVNSQNTNRSMADMTGKTVLGLFPGIAETDWYARLRQTATTGESQSFLFAYNRDSIRGWFDTLFVKLGNQVLFTDLNVTSLKEAELAKQQQADLLERVMNTTPTAIVLHESIRDNTGEVVDFRMIQVNEVAAKLMNTEVEHIINRRISRFFPDILTSPVFDQYKKVLDTGVSARFETHLLDQWYDFSVARFGDGILVAAQNITATHNYRQQLELTNTELKRSNESLQSFAYVASHDLQEPLRKLTSFADILTNQYAGQFNDDTTDIIRRMTASADRMRLLIQDLLTYAQVDIGQDSYKPVELNKLLAELKENELWAAVYQSKATLTFDELPTLTANPIQMRQLFQNLLSNALKFSAGAVPNVHVSGQLARKEDLPLSLRAAPRQPYYEIAVTDNGIGFDEKHTDRIFQVFQRLHGRSQYAGSGVGLAICQKIVERHGGAISATSELGKGSTFRVFLPIRS